MMDKFDVFLVSAAAILVVVAGLAVYGFMGLHTPVGDGSYTGQVIDYTHQKGFIFKVDDLTTKTHERSSQREHWCVPDHDKELVEKVRNIDEGSKVRIDYSMPLWISPHTCARSHSKIVDSITVVNSSR